MPEPYIGEIRLFPFGYAPRGWAPCDGGTLAIAQNQALFSILGTTYGGNGTTTFGLPDLRGRTPVHWGRNGVTIGQAGGQEAHTLTDAEMPLHLHQVFGTANAANQMSPAGMLWATNPSLHPYSKAQPDDTLNQGAIGPSGGGQPHANMQPYLTLNYCIAVVGLYPPRD